MLKKYLPLTLLVFEISFANTNNIQQGQQPKPQTAQQQTTQQTTRETGIYNNPFIAKEVEQLIKQAVDRIVAIETEKIKKEMELKYKQQIAQLEIRNLELQKKILELKKQIKELEKQIKQLEKQKEQQLQIIKVKNIAKIGNKVVLTLTDGTVITQGSIYKGYKIIKIDTENHIIVVEKNGKVYRVPYTLGI
jgi:predicted RNase H-like nuclease (RuvC/YqgF family)